MSLRWDRISLGVFACVALGGCLIAWRLSDTTPPSITLGLADPASYTSVLPLPPDGKVKPDKNGWIKVRAKVTDEGSGVVNATISVPGGFGAMHCSPTQRGFIGAGWDVRKVASGTVGTVGVRATDAAGNQASQTVTITVTR